MKVLSCTLIALACLSSEVAPAQSVQGAKPNALSSDAGPAVAPKPARLPDGRPNWTGFWVPPGGMLEVYQGPSGVTRAAAGSNPNTIPTAPRDDGPALKSPYKEQYAETLKKAAQGLVPDLTALCFPPGMPRMMGMIYGMEILQTADIISITSEWQAATRRIWMDLKTHPPADELDPTYAGHSIGRWEGDTLVVETVGVREDIPIDRAMTPHSANMRITERFSQSSPGVLTNEMTIVDPDALVTPVKQTRTYRYRPDLRLREYVCVENNRNVDPASGQATFK